jgi:hypothetical protein
MRLDAEELPVARANLRRTRQGVAHGVVREGIVHPVGLDHLIGVQEIAADKRREHRRARQAVHRRLGFHQGRMRRQAGNLHAVAVADLLHQQWILLHRERVEVIHLAEQFPAGVDHGLDPAVAEFRGDAHAGFERLVRRTAEFHVEGDFELGHGNGFSYAPQHTGLFRVCLSLPPSGKY